MISLPTDLHETWKLNHPIMNKPHFAPFDTSGQEIEHLRQDQSRIANGFTADYNKLKYLICVCDWWVVSLLNDLILVP